MCVTRLMLNFSLDSSTSVVVTFEFGENIPPLRVTNQGTSAIFYKKVIFGSKSVSQMSQMVTANLSVKNPKRWLICKKQIYAM